MYGSDHKGSINSDATSPVVIFYLLAKGLRAYFLEAAPCI